MYLSVSRLGIVMTYNAKYSFQNGLSVSFIKLVLLHWNGVSADKIQYGLMYAVDKTPTVLLGK